MEIRIDDLSGPEVRALLEEHLQNMFQITPPESVHALNIDALRQSDITFWTAWSDGQLLGCGALKELNSTHGEVKSMRTSMNHRRSGVGRAILTQIITESRKRSYTRLSLETGAMNEFEPARRLYSSYGFTFCLPFADYTEDPNSVFMTLTL